MTGQDIVVGGVVLVAFGLLVKKIIKARRAKKDKCGTCCGCIK